MRVIVAEKPSVARDLARILGASSRREGYLEGQGWRVTWALGHLVHLAEPDAYGEAWAGRWSFAQLPMLPERWRLRTDKKTAAQFKIVKALLTASDTERVICATDAGREGELIFRLIAEHARCRKPVQRLWISSLTDAAIRAGLAQLRDGHDYDALAAAARARAQADWLIGMNLPRAYTVHNRVLCTIGRVQTPTLAMIVARDLAIDAFVPTPFYELIARLAEGFEAKYHKSPQDQKSRRDHGSGSQPASESGPLQTAEALSPQGTQPPNTQGDASRSQPLADSEKRQASSDPITKNAGAISGEHPTRIDNKAEAEALSDRLRERIRPENLGKVVSVETKPQRNRPPPLFDLTTLQREANRRYGFTAAKTLELAQSLYETHKLISYPRTESRHIGEDLVPQLPGILRQLDHPLAREALARLEGGHRLGRAYVDQTKLTDHHAILPTASTPTASLPEPLRRIYDLVAARFVAVFLPDQQVDETRVELDIGGETFVAKGRQVTDPGWTRADPRQIGRLDRALGRTAGQREGTARQEGSVHPQAAASPGASLSSGSADGSAGAAGGRPRLDEAPLLPVLTPGQSVHVSALELSERETQPPKRFEDATLLNAMKHAGREIEDRALAAAMKGAGLGTPATRAETIEKLIRTGYVERSRKQLVATDKGRALIGLVAEPLKSAELTAGWEQRLKDIEEGRADANLFNADINRFVSELIPRVASGAAMPPEQVAAARAERAAANGATGNVGRRGRSASRSGQKARNVGARSGERPSWRSDGPSKQTRGAGEASVPAQARSRAVGQVRATTQAPAKTLAQRKVSAQAQAQVRPQARAEFPSSVEVSGPAPAAQSHTQPSAQSEARLAEITRALKQKPLCCPKCGQGQLIVGRRGYGCSRWRQGCDFVIWQIVAGHRLSEAELRALIERRETAPIDELRGDDGRCGTAVLRLGADDQVVPHW